MSSFWDTPDGIAALDARREDRAPLHEAMRQAPETIRCDYCERERPVDDVVQYADGAKVCGACREKERLRLAAMIGACPRGCDYDPAYHNADGSCPTEAEARGRSGGQ